MRSEWKKILCGTMAFAVAFFCTSRCAALDRGKDLRQCRMDVWTTRDGLPPRELLDLTQSTDGYLWIATRGGLVRFDGATFKTYKAGETPGLERGMIHAVHAAKDGSLWVGTDGEGFGQFRNGTYLRTKVGPDDVKWSLHDTFHDMTDGSMLVGGSESGGVQRIRNSSSKAVPNASNHIRAILEDDQGNLWLASQFNDLMKMDRSGRVVKVDFQFGHGSRIATTLAKTPDGSIWFGTPDKGLWRYSQGAIRPFGSREGLPETEIDCSLTDREGTLWVGTAHGVYRRTANGFIGYGKGEGLSSNLVTSLFEDREGNLWVGGKNTLHRFSNTRVTPYDLSSEAGTKINQLDTDRDGTLWVASNRGLFWQSKDGFFNRISGKTLPAGTDIQNVVCEADGTVWLRSQNQLWTVKNNKLTEMPPVSMRTTLQIMGKDRDRVVGLTAEGGYVTLSGVRREVPVKHSQTFYYFDRVQDARGTMWAASSCGLVKVTPDGLDVFTKGLPYETHVLGIALDSNPDRLWVSTDRGLGLFNGREFRLFDKSSGLPSENLYQIVSDGHGLLWIGDNRGIFSVKISDVNSCAAGRLAQIPYRMFESSEGVRHFPVTAGARRGSDGSLWFAGTQGLTRVEPARIAGNSLAPTPIIEEMTGNGRALLANGSIIAGRQAAIPGSASAAALNAAPGTSKFQIAFTAASMTASEKVLFRHRFLGYDNEWSKPDLKRSVEVTNLAPGDYVFEVQACNSDGVWSDNAASVKFTLLPYFWQTLNFKAGCVLLIALVCVALVRWRIGALARYSHELEMKVAERTNKIVEVNEELTAMNEELISINDELETSNQNLAEANLKLENLATTDGLTNIANHRSFQERLHQESNRRDRYNRPFSLLLIDVDHFKAYNDAFGHPAGDAALRGVAHILAEQLRDCIDMAARYGGEEFAVILPETSMEGALLVAERIRTRVAAFEFGHRHVTVSIGIAVSGVSSTAEEMISTADRALYTAKHNGRNCIEITPAPSVRSS